MTERGVSVREATQPSDPAVLFAALEPYRAWPDKPLRAAALWSRLHDERLGTPGRRLDPRVLDGLADRGIRPVVFGELYRPYEDVIAGMHDAELRDWGRALRGRGAWLRVDQEQNGGTPEDPHFPWQQQEPEVYREGVEHVRAVARSEAPDLLVMTSPSIRSRDLDRSIGPWIPKVDVVGFTAYQRGPLRDLGRQWAPLLAWYRKNHPGKPVCVSECGRLKGLDQRLEYASDLHRERGVDLVIAFDMDLESKAHWWRFTPRQRRAYMTGR
jgi:hypothetical protein